MVAKKKMNTFVAEKFGASKKKCELCSRFSENTFRKEVFSDEGKMLEWLKRRVWKARDLPKGFAGSNPALSAKQGCSLAHSAGLFCFILALITPPTG